MGHEHKIYFSIPKANQDNLRDTITRQPSYSGTIQVNGVTQYEFRFNSNDSYPDFVLVIENDGLYVCNNHSSKTWQEIEFIKKYLIDHNINYKIEEL
jgi:hypothetical protein